MNKLEVVLSEMSDEQLRVAVLEYKELQNTAVLCVGVIRTFANRVSDQAGISYGNSLNIVKNYVIETAALKWASGY